MKVGVPKEIKDNEYRVGLVPAGAAALVSAGHEVLVQQGGGAGSGIPDEAYTRAGAAILGTAAEVFTAADMVVKVKEPQPEEVRRLREGQILFTYLHLAPDRELTDGLIESGVTAIAYETITSGDGYLPLLVPMSEVAGRMSVQVGASILQRPHGGLGVLLSGIPGVPPARVVILGGGTVGINAAKIAVGMGARVTILDISAPRLRELDDLFGSRIETLMSTPHYVEESVSEADLVIGAVLIHGATAPRLVTRAMVGGMTPGSALVDVAVDQGGCFETTHPTTHSDPTYVIDGVLHYAVANMPGAVPRTSTFGLANVTLPYVLRLAGDGVARAIREDPGLRLGVNVAAGEVTHPAVAASQGRAHRPPEEILA
jgi:alanine dehydrogenase